MLHTKILLRQKNSTSKLKTSLNITESQHGLSKPKFLKDLSNDTWLSLWVKHGKNIHPLKLYRGVTFFLLFYVTLSVWVKYIPSHLKNYSSLILIDSD